MLFFWFNDQVAQAKAALVTGAGSGIGRAAAMRLAELGYCVSLVGRSEAKLRETAAVCGSAATLVSPADLLDPQACAAAVGQAVDRFGRLDALCNIAGWAQLASIARTTDQQWRAMLDTNLSAVFYLTRAVWPTFASQRSGVVVNVSSMASMDPFPGFAAYATAKAGLNMLTRITASEGAAIGLRAVVVAPGAVETPMLRSAFDERAIPRSATLDPRAVADLICRCVTGERSFTSGEVIPIVPSS